MLAELRDPHPAVLGGLDEMFTKIADFYDDEVDTAVEALLAAMERIMIVVMGWDDHGDVSADL